MTRPEVPIQGTLHRAICASESVDGQASDRDARLFGW
jgi:hypothetical protein